MKPKSKKDLIAIAIPALFLIFLLISHISAFHPGKIIAKNFGLFLIEMLVIFPPAFILVGIFEVWIRRETVERYFGQTSGIRGYIGAIILSCTTLYPFVVVLPIALSLYKKGARLSVVLTYMGATAICRIPMTIFEISFMGLGFSITRYLVSLPLIVISSILIEGAVKKDIKQNRLGIDMSEQS